MNDNRCLYCDEIVPEGREVCPICESLSAFELLKRVKEKYCKAPADSDMDVLAKYEKRREF